jgi:hypothetical protein
MKLSKLATLLSSLSQSSSSEASEALRELAKLFDDLDEMTLAEFTARARKFRRGSRKDAPTILADADEKVVRDRLGQLVSAGTDANAFENALQRILGDKRLVRLQELSSIANLYTGHRGAFKNKTLAAEALRKRVLRYAWDAEAFSVLKKMRGAA